MDRSEIIEKSKKMFLDYVNNFLTVSYLAEYYQIEEEIAIQMLMIGRFYHEKECEATK